MLSEEDLSRIVKDEVENLIKKGEMPDYTWFILFDGRMYTEYDYTKELVENKHSLGDVYAYVHMGSTYDLDDLLFISNYFPGRLYSIVALYLQKKGFTIEGDILPYPPTPKVKYYIISATKFNEDDKPEYLVNTIYNFDVIANSLGLPQLIEQKFGSKPKKITTKRVLKIADMVAEKQPLIAGYSPDDAWYILYEYYVRHETKYRNEAIKVFLAWNELFPISYKACYKWKAGAFDKIDCLKLELHSSSS